MAPLPELSADTVRRAARGEARARRALVERHGPMLYGICRRLAPDPEDCYQAIWEKIFRGLARFDPAGSAKLSTWMATIAHRHLIDRHRRRSVRGVVLPLDELSTDAPSAEALVGAREEHQRLEVALRRLPAAQRRVVVMHHINGLPLEKIAEQEGVAVGTIKSRLHRGRARLTQLLVNELKP